MEKVCTKCEVSKPASEFYKDKRKKDGLRSWCKKCQLADNAKREKKYNETRKKYREENEEEVKLNKKKYYRKNKESILAQNAEWRQSLKGRLASYKRAANKRMLEWELTDEEFKEFWNEDCAYCGDEIEGVGIDRMDSSKGYTMDNCIPCCTTCNTIKSNLEIKKFLKQVEKIHKHKFVWEELVK